MFNFHICMFGSVVSRIIHIQAPYPIIWIVCIYVVNIILWNCEFLVGEVCAYSKIASLLHNPFDGVIVSIL